MEGFTLISNDLETPIRIIKTPLHIDLSDKYKINIYKASAKS